MSARTLFDPRDLLTWANNGKLARELPYQEYARTPPLPVSMRELELAAGLPPRENGGPFPKGDTRPDKTDPNAHLYEGRASRGKEDAGVVARPADPETVAALNAAREAVSRHPFAEYGWDPAAIRFSRRSTTASAGTMYRQPGYPMWAANRDFFGKLSISTPVHEAVHRGVHLLLDLPDAPKHLREWAILDRSNANEMIARYVMLDRMGDPEQSDVPPQYRGSIPNQREEAIAYFESGMDSAKNIRLLRELENFAEKKLADAPGRRGPL